MPGPAQFSCSSHSWAWGRTCQVQNVQINCPLCPRGRGLRENRQGRGAAWWGPWAGSSSRPRRTAGLEHRVGTVGGNEVRTVGGPAHREVLARSPHLHQLGPFPGGKPRLYFQQRTDGGRASRTSSRRQGSLGCGGAAAARVCGHRQLRPQSACLGEACLPLLPESDFLHLGPTPAQWVRPTRGATHLHLPLRASSPKGARAA